MQPIKKLVIILLINIFSLCSAQAQMTSTLYQETSAQFANRGWDLYSADNLRKSHLLDFDNSNISTRLKNLYLSIENKFRNIMSQDYDSLDISFFYPEVVVVSNSDVISESLKYKELASLYTMLVDWNDLFLALGTEHWNDLGTCSGDILNNIDCGRESKVNYVIQHLSQERRSQLGTLKNVLNSEIVFATNSNLNLNYDDSLVKFFQFINYQNIFGSVLNSKFLLSGNDPIKTKKIFIESMRAILINIFKTNGGVLQTSDLDIIDIEPVGYDLDAMYTHYKNLLYKSGTNQDVSDLMFDVKVIPPLLSYYLSLTNETEKQKFINNLNDFLVNVLFLDVNDEDLNLVEKAKVRHFLEEVVEYILNNPTSDSLKLAKKIEYFIKGWE